MEQNNNIRLGHGSGGKLTHELIENLFIPYFDNEILREKGDSALFQMPFRKLAFTTDSYVVDPLFFPGGNIGKLAISGTVNDLAVTGAVPAYISVGFIIEEGFPLDQLEIIIKSMAEEAHDAGVLIITGDTKVVNKGKCDKIFINTSGVGMMEQDYSHISSGVQIKEGDKIIINGYSGDHGIAILGERESLKFSSGVQSDVTSLNTMISDIIARFNIHFMRDATRGGIATVLAEMAESRQIGVGVDETSIPVREEVKGICEVFGYDPLYIANEGKVVMVVPAEQAEQVLNRLQNHKEGKDSAIIGNITSSHNGKVVLNTEIGSQRFLDMLSGEQLPRIC